MRKTQAKLQNREAKREQGRKTFSSLSLRYSWMTREQGRKLSMRPVSCISFITFFFYIDGFLIRGRLMCQEGKKQFVDHGRDDCERNNLGRNSSHLSETPVRPIH